MSIIIKWSSATLVYIENDSFGKYFMYYQIGVAVITITLAIFATILRHQMIKKNVTLDREELTPSDFTIMMFGVPVKTS